MKVSGTRVRTRKGPRRGRSKNQRLKAAQRHVAAALRGLADELVPQPKAGA
jgi:hypothetical protein